MGVAAAVIGAGVIGAAASVYAGSEQASAANNAANVSLKEANASNALIQKTYDSNKALLSPFVDAGTSALTELQGMAGQASFSMTADQLAQTPGYQFALHQGLLATQAGSSAQGMGSAVAGVGSGQTPGVGPSGPLGKALANYAEGLASTTYQQQFQNYLTTNQQNYNQLAGIVNTGEAAGSAIAGVGQTAAGQSANALMTGAGQYGSATTAGAAASAAGITGAASSLGNSALLYGVLGGGGGSNAFAGGVASGSASYE